MAGPSLWHVLLAATSSVALAGSPNNYLALIDEPAADRMEVGGWHYYGPAKAHLGDVPAVYLTGYELCSMSQEHRTMRKEVGPVVSKIFREW